MKKTILTAAACILMAGTIQAQETLYLVKGDRVVGKYNVADVDYATFELPEGVKDIDDGPVVTPPEQLNKEFLSAQGTYFGTQDGVANFQIELNSNPVGDESFPRTFLYLQFMSNAADYRDLKFEDGTYTIGDGETLEPFKFHPGVVEWVDTEIGQQQGAGGTFYVYLETGDSADLKMAEGGEFTIKTIDNMTYTVEGTLQLAGNVEFAFSYTGIIFINNMSDEKDPAEEVPNPESTITADINLGALADAYISDYGHLLADEPRFTYYALQFYPEDAVNDYNRCLEIGLVVDREKFPGQSGNILPRGTYPVIARTHSQFEANDEAALPGWCIAHDMGIAHYGCWYVDNYTDYSPLEFGEIVVQDSDSTTLVLSVSLRDAKGHTVTATYSGKPYKI